MPPIVGCCNISFIRSTEVPEKKLLNQHQFNTIFCILHIICDYVLNQTKVLHYLKRYKNSIRNNIILWELSYVKLYVNNLTLVILFTVTWANCTTLTPCLTTSSIPKTFINQIWLDLPLSDSLAEWPVVEVQSALSTLPKRPEEWPQSPINHCPLGCGQLADVLSFLLALVSWGETGNWTKIPAEIYAQSCLVTIEFHIWRNKKIVPRNRCAITLRATWWMQQYNFVAMASWMTWS